MKDAPREISLVADGLTYRGLSWGDPSAPLVFAIHGWLDNALSFARLAPLMEGCHFVAIDLSGHGLSSHRSADASYHIWDEIPQLLKVIDQLTHEPVAVIGHSRGAAVAALLATALGDRCSSLAMLDGMLFRSFENDNGATLLRDGIAELTKYSSRPPRIFDAVEDFIKARSRYGFTRENAEVLVPRALERVDEGWLLRSDPRLFAASMVKLSDATAAACYESMDFPVMAIMGADGFFTSEGARDMIARIGKHAPHFRQIDLAGPHHFHLEGEVAGLASILLETMRQRRAA